MDINRQRKWLNPDFWSIVGMFVLTALGFFLLAKINQSERSTLYQPRSQSQFRRQARLVIPQTLPSDVIPKLSAINPKSLSAVVERMAEDAMLISTSMPIETIAEWTPTRKVERPVRPTPNFSSRTYVSGLSSPDGIAIDPRTGNIFVSEEDANRIAMITPRGKVKTVIDQDTRLIAYEGKIQKRLGPIKSPEGLAMDSFGRLYVVEDRIDGRILAIQMEENGRVGTCEVIQVPGQGAQFQWEGIAVRDTGELLLTGSTAESANLGSGGMVQGALVYRDEVDRWWVPVMRPGAGFSGVAFSKDGQFAVYCDEITGTLGWVDLQSRYLREGASQRSFKSPEGVCVLPDGRIAVAEEGGRISLLDGEADEVAMIADSLGAIESVHWDERAKRLLVTADGSGSLLELAPDSMLDYSVDRMQRAQCQAEGAIRHVPDTTPDFIRPLLELGGLSDLNPDFDIAFDELTRKIPMLASDARAILLQGRDDVPDPVVHLRFIALDPNRLKFDEPGFDFALSMVVLRTRSGIIYKTHLTRTVIITGNMWTGIFKNHGSFDVPVPFAYHAQPGPRGHAVIHFTGLGRSPDIAIALNPTRPEESYMLITQIDGALEQYRLEQTRSASGEENWVVSMPARRPQVWLNITDPKDRLPVLTL